MSKKSDSDDDLERSDINPIDVSKLIQTVKNYPELYSPTHVQYSDSEHRNAVWDKIAEEFGATVSLCKKKWNSVRDCYLRYLKKLQADSTLTKYRHADILQFLGMDSSYCHLYNPVEDIGSDDPSEDQIQKKVKALLGKHGVKYKSEEEFLRSHEGTQCLINLIKPNTCLYDLSDPDYVNLSLKLSVWKNIGKKLQCRVRLCKARWCNIRDNYRKSYMRREDGDRKKYLFSKHLQFLAPFLASGQLKPKKFNKTITKKKKKFTSAHLDTGQDKEYEVDSDTNHKDNLCYVENMSDINLDMIKQENTDYFETISLNQNEDHMNSALLNDVSDLNQEESISAFLSGLAPTLKSLSPYYLNRAKTEIFAIVQKYELEMIVEKGQKKKKI